MFDKMRAILVQLILVAVIVGEIPLTTHPNPDQPQEVINPDQPQEMSDDYADFEEYPLAKLNELDPVFYPYMNRGSNFQTEPDVSSSLKPSDSSVKEDFECPTEYGFYPDPNGNCSEYYQCLKHKPEKQVCSGGLQFNPVTKLCDYPGKSSCYLACPQPNGVFPIYGRCDSYLDCAVGRGTIGKCAAKMHFNALTQQCDTPNGAKCEIKCTEIDTLVPLPGRYNMYASCSEGIATYHRCPEGLIFNGVLLICDLPTHPDSNIQVCPALDGYFPVLGQCSSYILCRNGHGELHTCPSHLHFNFILRACEIPNIDGCAPKCEKPNGFFPYPGVCSLYIKCLQGIPFLQSCAENLKFNVATGQCDNVPEDQCLPKCPRENGLFSIQGDCQAYKHCRDNKLSLKRCPSKFHFDALLQVCEREDQAQCKVQCPSKYGVYPIRGSCDMFYHCDNSTAIVHYCAEGLHFNARTFTCDWPLYAHCDPECTNMNGYYPIQGDCNAYLVCLHGQRMVKTCPAGKHFNVEEKRCDLPEVANCIPKCPVDDGMFVLPGYCDSYLHCVEGKPHVENCPPGLWFSSFTGLCDLPEYVYCPAWK